MSAGTEKCLAIKVSNWPFLFLGWPLSIKVVFFKQAPTAGSALAGWPSDPSPARTQPKGSCVAHVPLCVFPPGRLSKGKEGGPWRVDALLPDCARPRMELMPCTRPVTTGCQATKYPSPPSSCTYMT